MDWGTFFAAAGALIALGFAAGFSATFYALTVYLLSNHARGERLVYWMVLGMAIGKTLLLVVFHGFDPSFIADTFKTDTRRFILQNRIDLVAGCVFLALGLWLLYRARLPKKVKQKKPPRIGRVSPGGMVTVGVVNSVLGLSGPVFMYSVARVIIEADSHFAQSAVLYSIFLLTLAAPYLAVAWSWNRVPSAQRTINRFSTWYGKLDTRRPFAFLVLTVGAVYLTLGLLR